MITHQLHVIKTSNVDRITHHLLTCGICLYSDCTVLTVTCDVFGKCRDSDLIEGSDLIKGLDSSLTVGATNMGMMRVMEIA